MDLNNINSILEQFHHWHYDEHTSEEVEEKCKELHIFDINFTTIVFEELSEEAQETARNLKRIFSRYISDEEKQRQLQNNPNIMKFACSIDQFSNIGGSAVLNLLTMIREFKIQVDDIKKLEFIQDALNGTPIYEENIKNIINDIELTKQNQKQAAKILSSIIKESYKKNISALFFPIIEKIPDDDLKIKISMDLLTYSYPSLDVFIHDATFFLRAVKEVDKKIELYKKILEFQDNRMYGFALLQNDADSFLQNNASFLLERMIYSFGPVYTMEEAHYFIKKFEESVNDEKLKKYMNSDMLATLFNNFQYDFVIVDTFNELTDNSTLSPMLEEPTFIEKFVNCFHDDKIKITIMKQFLNRGLLDYDYILKQLQSTISNKSLFLDGEIMESIYLNPKFSISIAGLFYTLPSDVFFIFKKGESQYIKNNQLDQLLTKYKNIGIIDDETLNSVYQFASKYIKNLTKEDMYQRIENSPNFKEILEWIATSVQRETGINVSGTYKEELKKIETLFSKTRFASIPDLATYKKMSLDFCKKFDLKTWNQLIQNPLFHENEDTKKSLIDVIVMTGLFENDSEVLMRRRQVNQLFYNYRTMPYTKHTLNEYFYRFKEDIINKYFQPTTITSYQIRVGVQLPEILTNWLQPSLSENQMDRIRKTTGNIGSELNKFLSPYAKGENGWKLKNGILLDMYSDYLKEEMTDKEYMEILNSAKTPQSIKNFLKPYEKIETQGYRLKDDIDLSIKNNLIDILLHSNISWCYTIDTLHRLFSGINESYNPEFYQFFMDNQDQILADPMIQLQFKDVFHRFDTIKRYYAQRGNDSPNYNDMIAYLKEAPYDITFGNEEFASDAKNNLVPEEGYAFYEELLKKTRNRHLTTVPRHEKTYEYKDSSGNTYQVMGKVLRADDPFNLLVGEARFSNCCQRYSNAGESCMIHASTSQNGGIFATYLIIDGTPTMLTQSWFWTNEAKACLDNVEATSIITQAPVTKKRLLQDIATFAIVESCKDMIKQSKIEMDKYIAEKSKKINSSALSDVEKKKEFDKLETIRKRQTLTKITVGEGYDDLRVRESFKEIEEDSLSYGPKKYIGYRDSHSGQQHIIIDTKEKMLPMDKNYEDVAIYRDDRVVKEEIGSSIRYDTLRKITDISLASHKEEMRQYVDENQNYLITEKELLADMYNCPLENLQVLLGEDWYFIYSNNTLDMEIYDLAKKEPRLEDEGSSQNNEIMRGFDKILEESLQFDDDGHVTYRKTIKADLREDTSYLLYLALLKRGNIEQVGDDAAYPFFDEKRLRIYDKKEQDNILKNRKQIKKEQNPNIMMHKVKFKATDKEIEKILESRKNRDKEIGEAKNVK